MKKVLLHICCGVCASWPIEKLKIDGFSVTGFFHNPNIQPEEEYQTRLEAAEEATAKLGMELIQGSYDRENWFNQIKGLENEPEGGKRCLACYRFRLQHTYNEVRKLSFDYFTTTLSISPHKDSQAINEIGKSVSLENFLKYDFKKDNGFEKAMAFSKKHNLYRQHYCGCIFSQKQGS